MRIEGFLDGLEPTQLRGWAYDAEHSELHFEVELHLGDVKLGEVVADLYRRDLEHAGVGRGDHAFIFNCEWAIPQGELPNISAFAVVPGQERVPLERLGAEVIGAGRDAGWPTCLFDGFSRDDGHRPVFVLGAARSGTSAVVGALNATTRYRGPPEGHFFDVLAPLLVSLHDFYDAKGDEWSGGRDTMISRVPESFVRDGIGHIAIVAARQMFPTGYWMDKTPNSNMVHLAPRLLEIWPNARFIFMKRRAIENLQSRLKKFDYDFEHNCREWVDTMEAWLAVRGQLSGAALELDQHFMRENADQTAAFVGHLVDLNAEETARFGKLLHVSRPQRGGVEKAKISSLESTGWSATWKDAFVKICGPAMRAYGYGLYEGYYEPGNAESNGARMI